jgi:DNA-binding NarL/FixJ family response regulator
LRVHLASDDPLARGGLSALIAAVSGLEVAGQSALADDWGARARDEDAEVVIVDLGAVEGAGDALAAVPDLPVLALVTDESQGRAALAAGARGVLLRDAGPERLEAALRALARGLVVLDEAAAALLRPRAPAALPTAETLTPREMEALQLLSEGLSNRQIAERLRIGERTAKFHVNSILAKLGAETRTEAVVLAARLGLVIL